MRNTRKRQSTGHRGFTLIEVLAVITLMSLILSISAAIVVNGLAGSKQKAAAREIISTLRYAKHLASAKNEKQTVLFDLDAGTFGISGRSTSNIPEKTKLEICENNINSEPIVQGQYKIFYDMTGSSPWNRILLYRGERVIQIKPDPIQTAYLANSEEDELEK